MKRSVLASLMILAFTLAAAATLSAAPLYVSYGGQTVAAQNWVGDTRGQLVREMGKPDQVLPSNDGGQSLRFIKHMYVGRGNRIQVVEQFDVNSNGRIVSASVYRM